MSTAVKAQRDAFGARMRTLRRQRGLTIREIVAELEKRKRPVTLQAVSAWERGEYAPDAPTVRILERFLGAGEGELLVLLDYNPGPTVEDRLSAVESELEDLRTMAMETLDLVRKLARRRPPPTTTSSPRQASS